MVNRTVVFDGLIPLSIYNVCVSCDGMISRICERTKTLGDRKVSVRILILQFTIILNFLLDSFRYKSKCFIQNQCCYYYFRTFRNPFSLNNTCFSVGDNRDFTLYSTMYSQAYIPV